MKILFTSPYQVFPANAGGAVRTLNLALAFARLGHEVHLLCAAPDRKVEEPRCIQTHYFRSVSALGYFLNLDFKRQLAKCLGHSFDLVIAGFPYQAWMIYTVMRKHKVPLVYDAHNVEADRFRKMRRPLSGFLVKMAERRICAIADRILTVSQNDRQLMQQIHGADSLVLANGVDTSYMSPGRADSEALQRSGLEPGQYVLFFGSYDYPPNIEAAHFLIEKVWPEVMQSLPDAKLALVGRSPQPWMAGHAGVLVTGAVDSIAEVVKGARIVVAPLFSGGGTRLKIVEALACGKTVLATPFGAMGIVSEGSAALLLAEPQCFTKELIGVMQQPMQDICGNIEARKLAMAFDWQQLAREIEPQLSKLLPEQGSD